MITRILSIILLLCFFVTITNAQKKKKRNEVQVIEFEDENKITRDEENGRALIIKTSIRITARMILVPRITKITARVIARIIAIIMAIIRVITRTKIITQIKTIITTSIVSTGTYRRATTRVFRPFAVLRTRMPARHGLGDQ